MSTFSALPEFEKEFKKLAKKYPTIPSDVDDIKSVLIDCPTGIGKNFTIIKIDGEITIVKVRVHCESLRSRVIRLIYAYHKDKIEFMYIELYFKGEKENEDKERVKEYILKFKK
jgi:hypothetical protein